MTKARTLADNFAADISGITAGTGITGGGTSGTVTITNDMATAIDAKGDLVVGTGADSYDNLTAGSNGDTLVADSAATTGLRWQGNYAAGKNKIINGDFAINQRGFTSTTSTTSVYGFDRWLTSNTDGTVTRSAQTFTPGTAPVSGYESTNFIRIETTGQTLASADSQLHQRIEDVRTFAGQTITISFWAKALSGTPKIAVEVSQAFGTGGSPSSTVNTYAGQVTTSTSWARYSVTVAVPSISGKTIGTDSNSSSLPIRFHTSAGSDLNARTGSLGIQNATIDIWGVQVEAGSVATAFQTATGTIQGELAACQRYYFRITNSAGDRLANNGYASSTSVMRLMNRFPVTMRVKPTAVEQSGTAGDYSVAYAATGVVCTSVPSFVNSSTDHAFTNFTASIAPFTVGGGGEGYAQNATGYLGWSAEL